ncbi:putative ochratoxin a non-ribosomal peptide synthetase protein [Botrytis fragariae]|uniref:Putative ochratoxin a non-ribosomal peptide synthetase protein n=1 Tax=Botrytis fragariae TaxID=1964551 RepID=A0A8H6EG51_9HELO|nr:putative ochratoxin a non-ribosomal peptide synthetase protein [Botrytis fragariae]KAF5870933.1 putative ochratoxin a non-ribosomal peptide synthetase protein [Botrytis fragariae]
MSSAQLGIVVRTHEQIAQWQNAPAPHIVEQIGRQTSDNKYGEWVSKDSVVAITYAQLTKIIGKQLGDSGRYAANPKVLAYVGTNDVHYSAQVLAAAKVATQFTLVTSNLIPLSANVTLDAVSRLRHFMVPSVALLTTYCD